MTILGDTFQFDIDKDENKQLSKILNEIPWFSYKKNFNTITIDNKDYFLTTDVGWGCMI